MSLAVTDCSSCVQLRSAKRGDMFIPRTRTQLGRRSFRLVAGTPSHSIYALHQLVQFRARLKAISSIRRRRLLLRTSVEESNE